MNDFTEFHEVIKDYITNPNANYYEPFWWDKELKVILADLPKSIRFLREECTDEEFYYLSEVFDDIIEQTKSVDFLKCIRERAERVENAQWRCELAEDIRFAALYVDEN